MQNITELKKLELSKVVEFYFLLKQTERRDTLTLGTFLLHSLSFVVYVESNCQHCQYWANRCQG